MMHTASNPAAPSPRLRPLWVTLAVIAVVKLAILAANGPSLWPDSGSYIAYADAILDHGRAFAPIAWGAEALPPFIFRPVGYPLILAGAELISPSEFAVATVIFQSIVNGVAIYLIFVVAARLLPSIGAAIAAVVIYAGSTSILWDNSILSDSLYASLWNIVIFVLLGRLLGCWRLALWQSCGLGALWGFSLWVRDVGIYFVFLPVILFLVIAVKEAEHRRAVLARLFVFLLTVSGMVSGTVLLNFHRTGEMFFGITGVENWLRPVFGMAQAGYAQPFADDGLVSTTIRDSMTDYGFESQLRFLVELHRRCRCTPTQLQSLVRAKYVATIGQHPVAYARVVADNFSYFALGELVADPVATLDQFLELGASKPEWRFPGFSRRNLAGLKSHFSTVTLLLMIASALGEILSALVFSAYLFLTPYVLLLRSFRGQPKTAEWGAAAFLWFSFVGVSFAFSLVHFEARHALPLFPAAAIGIVYIASCLRAGGDPVRASTPATGYRQGH